MKKRGQMPLGVCFALAVVVALIGVTPFRMPPMSRSASLTYYAIAQEGHEPIPTHISKTLSGNGFTLAVDAPVVYPDGACVPVYQGHAFVPDLARLQSVLFGGLAPLQTQSAQTSLPGDRFDLTTTTVAFEQGYIRLREDGACSIVWHTPSIAVRDVDEARNLLRRMGYPVDHAAFAWDAESAVYAITQNVDGIGLSAFPAFDAATGKPTEGSSFEMRTSEGRLASISGQFWVPGKALWPKSALVIWEDAMDNLAGELFASGAIDHIALKYHGRDIPAQPRERLLYPVWELTGSDSQNAVILLNAITGDIELLIMDEEGEAENAEFSQ
ncbi:MAG: hypothetical protein RR296_10575 [Clostridia bacterium]